MPLGNPISSLLSWTLGLVHKFKEEIKKTNRASLWLRKNTWMRSRTGKKEWKRQETTQWNQSCFTGSSEQKKSLRLFFFLIRDVLDKYASDQAFWSKFPLWGILPCRLKYLEWWNFVTYLSNIVTAFSDPAITFMYYKITKGYVIFGNWAYKQVCSLSISSEYSMPTFIS